MSLKSEREKAAQGLMNEETGCSHIPNFSALDCSECGRNALIALQRAAEKRAMKRLLAYMHSAVEYDPIEGEWSTKGDEPVTQLVACLPLSIDQLLDEDDET